ncbi:MAG: HD domain-containing protein [Candidatus Latescibacterota bacterium]
MGSIMPLANWQEDILKQGELYYVGGAVRDRLLGVESAAPDADYLVRGVPPEALERLLAEHGNVQLVGKSFGVYKFTPGCKKRKAHAKAEARKSEDPGPPTEDGLKMPHSTQSHAKQTVDIAYPRKEACTGPGHRDFRVEFDWTLPIEADLERRDFTINAIAENIRDGTIVDPLHGADDLRQRLLRMVFPEAFEEDALRILRGARFKARFGLTLDSATREAMRRGVAHLAQLSPERVQEEFAKLLTQCGKPSTGFELLQDIGALDVVFPELARCAGVTQNEYHPDDVFVHSLKSCDCAPQDRLEVRWAALLHDLGKVDRKMTVEEQGKEPRVVFYGHEDEGVMITRRVLTRLRCSNALIDSVQHLVAHHMFDYTPDWSDAGVRRFIRKVGEEHLENLFLLREADCCSRGLTDSIAELRELKDRIKEQCHKDSAFKVTDLAVKGGDLMDALGIEQGKTIGRVLAELLEAVLADPSLNKKDQLIELARKLHPN